MNSPIKKEARTGAAAQAARLAAGFAATLGKQRRPERDAGAAVR